MGLNTLVIHNTVHKVLGLERSFTYAYCYVTNSLGARLEHFYFTTQLVTERVQYYDKDFDLRKTCTT